jgi:uncharacterized protein YceK
MKTLLLITVVLLAGCGATIKAASPRSVVIHAMTIQSAQALADKECEKHRRFAEFVTKPDGFIWQFRCVE